MIAQEWQYTCDKIYLSEPVASNTHIRRLIDETAVHQSPILAYQSHPLVPGGKNFRGHAKSGNFPILRGRPGVRPRKVRPARIFNTNDAPSPSRRRSGKENESPQTPRSETSPKLPLPPRISIPPTSRVYNSENVRPELSSTLPPDRPSMAPPSSTKRKLPVDCQQRTVIGP